MEQTKKTVIGTIVEGFKNSTKAVNEINKENMAAVKAESKANFVKATTPSPEFENFKQAKGFKNKVKAAADGMKASTRAAAEKEKERRAEAQNHTAYAETLKTQREHRQAGVK